MVKIGDNKYENSKRLIVALLILTMIMQILLPLIQVAADSNDECIRMLESIEDSSIYHVKEKEADQSFEFSMQFAISSKNTDGNSSVLIENTFNDKLKIMNARLVDKDNNEIADVLISGQDVSAELNSADKAKWIDEELKIVVTAKQDGMQFGEIIENNFTVSFDNKSYTSNTVEVVFVKDIDLGVSKTGSVEKDGNLLKYNVSHRILDKVELKELGYKLENGSITKYKFEDDYLIMGQPGLYNYENITILANGIDVTNNDNLKLTVNNSAGKFTIEYSPAFIEEYFGANMSIEYELKTKHEMDQKELEENLLNFGFVADDVLKVINNATLNVGLRYTSTNTEIETTLNANDTFTNILNQKKDIIAIKKWPEEKNAPYINKNVEYVELVLKANNVEIDKQMVDADNNWTHTFTDLPVRDNNGLAINYSLEEGEISTNGPLGNYAIAKSSRTPGELHVINQWRAPSLYLSKEATQKDNPSGLSANKLLDLSEREVKQVVEFVVPDVSKVAPFEHYKYELTDTINGLGLFAIDTNSLSISVGDIDVSNEIDYSFSDNDTALIMNFPETFLLNNQSETITIEYNVVVDEVNAELPDEEFEELLETMNAKQITSVVLIREFYKVDDSVPTTRYKSSAKSASFAYDRYYGVIDIPVKKQWVGTPLSSIEVDLLADGVVVDTVILEDNNDWKHVFKDMPERNSDKSMITYEVVENLQDASDSYAQMITGDVYEGFLITNREIQNIEYINIPVIKTWVGAPLSKINIQLYGNDKLIQTQRLTEDDNWSYVFANLPTVSPETGELIDYTVKEEKLDNYTQKVEGSVEDGFVITNTKHLVSSLPKVCNFKELMPNAEVKSIKITKKWIGKIANSAEIELFANDELVNSVVLNEDNNWTVTVDNLPVKDSANKEINYTIKEVEIKGYTSEIKGNSDAGFIVTNTEITEENGDNNNNDDKTTSIKVSKEWIGVALKKATINLLSDDKVIDTVELNATNDWKHEFTDLDVYHENEEGELVRNAYSIKEVEIEGYTSLIKKTGNKFTVVNVQDGEELPGEIDTFNFSIKKVWEGKKLNEAKVVLYANGKESAIYTLNESNNWKVITDDLPTHDNNKEINYEIKEIPVKGYISTMTGSVEAGFTITNTEIIEPKFTSIKINKIWIGDKLPEATISLVANGNKIVDTVILNDSKQWTHTFENLPVQENNKDIKYSVIEHVDKNYDVEITGSPEQGFVIKNTKKFNEDTNNSEKTVVSVKKQWQGGKEKDATIALVANGDVINVAVLDDSNGWAYVFYGLPKYDKFNSLIKYSILEFGQENYDTVIKGSVESGFTVTNTKVAGNNGNNNNNNPNVPRPPVRPPSNSQRMEINISSKWIGNAKDKLVVNLLANGDLLSSATLTAKDQWKHTFKNLETHKNGKPIQYSIEELKLPGYEVQITGNPTTGFAMIITQTDEEVAPEITPEVTPENARDLIVKASWVGRPADEITAVLYANEEEIDKVILNSANNWEYTFRNLPIAEDENAVDKILYTIETLPIEGYKTEIENMFEDMNDGQHIGFIITNYKTDDFENQTIDIHVRKSWVGKMLSNATIHLLKNKEIIDTVVLNKSNNWEYTFRELEKFNENGRLNRYEISEEPIKGYEIKVVQVEDNAYLVINEELDGMFNDRDHIKDVQTYDEGVMMTVVILILSITAFVIIQKKKEI